MGVWNCNGNSGVRITHPPCAGMGVLQTFPAHARRDYTGSTSCDVQSMGGCDDARPFRPRFCCLRPRWQCRALQVIVHCGCTFKCLPSLLPAHVFGTSIGQIARPHAAKRFAAQHGRFFLLVWFAASGGRGECYKEDSFSGLLVQTRSRWAVFITACLLIVIQCFV